MVTLWADNFSSALGGPLKVVGVGYAGLSLFSLYQSAGLVQVSTPIVSILSSYRDLLRSFYSIVLPFIDWIELSDWLIDIVTLSIFISGFAGRLYSSRGSAASIEGSHQTGSFFLGKMKLLLSVIFWPVSLTIMLSNPFAFKHTSMVNTFIYEFDQAKFLGIQTHKYENRSVHIYEIKGAPTDFVLFHDLRFVLLIQAACVVLTSVLITVCNYLVLLIQSS